MKLAVLAAGAVLLAAACGEGRAPAEARPTPTPTLERVTTAGTRTTSDMLGRRVEVPARVERVVALSPSAVEFATALGVDVVGRPSDGAPAAAGAIGLSISPDFNAVAALRPDLVLADASLHGARIKDFDQFPYPVFVLRAGSFDEVIAALSAVGEALGRPEKAAEAVAAIRARVDAVLDRVRGAPVPTVLILTGTGRDVYAASDATYAGSLVTKLGGRNVLGAVPSGGPIAGYGLVEVSQVAARNPQVVLVIPAGSGGLAAEIRGSPAWAGSAAVRAGRVVELDTGLYLRSPGPRAAEAIEQLAGMLYPERR
jgi:iron complex transport system substrate-binding protein